MRSFARVPIMLFLITLMMLCSTLAVRADSTQHDEQVAWVTKRIQNCVCLPSLCYANKWIAYQQCLNTSSPASSPAMLEECIRDADQQYPDPTIARLAANLIVAMRRWNAHPDITPDLLQDVCDAAGCDSVLCPECLKCPACPECKVELVTPWVDVNGALELIWSHPLESVCCIVVLVLASSLWKGMVDFSWKRLAFTSAVGAVVWGCVLIVTGHACAPYAIMALGAAGFICYAYVRARPEMVNVEVFDETEAKGRVLQEVSWRISTKLWDALASAPTAAQRGRVVDAYLGPLSGGIAADVREWVSSNWASLKAEPDCSALHSYLDEQGIVEHMMDE